MAQPDEEQLDHRLAGWGPLLLLGALVVLGVATAIAMRGTEASLDEFPQYLEAVATAGALIAATVAAVYTQRAARYAYRAFQLESRRERDRVDAIERSQAALVAAWPVELNIRYKMINGVELRDSPEQLVGVRVAIRNASSMPVKDFKLNFLVEVRTNGEVVEAPIVEHLQGWLPPSDTSETLDVPLRQPADMTQWGDPKDLVIDPKMITEFTDLVGTQWIRTPRNQLLPLARREWSGSLWDL